MKFSTKDITLARGLTKKRTVRVQVAESVALTGGYWDGGSRTEWRMLDMAGNRLPLSYPTSPAQFGGAEPPTVTIEPGRVIVRGGVFCGKEATTTLFVHPTDLLHVVGVTQFSLPAEPTEFDYICMFDRLEEIGFGELRPYKYKHQMA